MKKYITLFFLLLIVFDNYAQIVNKGELKSVDGTVLYIGDSFINTSSGTIELNGNTHFNSNLINDGLLTSSDGSTYFDSKTSEIQSIDGSSKYVKFNNLFIENQLINPIGLAVADGFNLEVNNAVIINSGKLRLIGESQLLQNHSGISLNTGLKPILIDQQGAKNAYRYNYWSSPVQSDLLGNYQVQNILKDGSIPNLFNPTSIGLTSNANGNDASNPIQISTRWLYKHINAQINGGNGVDWQNLYILNTLSPSAENNVLSGQGFIMKGVNVNATYSEFQNYTFEGIPNDGNYSINLLNNREYLIGNPYPSAIDANAFILDNISNFDGTLYFWEHWSTNTHVYSAYGGGYAAYNLSGGVIAPLDSNFINGSGTGSLIPKRYIPVGQGFVIQSATSPGGNILFRNSQRVFEKEGVNSTFFKTIQDNDEVVISRIRLQYISPVQGTRDLLFAHTNNIATNGYDKGFDGKILEMMPNDLFFTFYDEGRNDPYQIQGIGLYNEMEVYPLTLVAQSSGTHTIKIKETENFDYPVYILDLETQTTQNLLENDFVINLNSGNYSNRFKLVFSPYSALNIENELNGLIKIYFSKEKILIENPTFSSIEQLQVYNNLGQIVLQIDKKEALLNQFIEIPFNFAKGAYVINIISNQKRGTFKLINY